MITDPIVLPIAASNPSIHNATGIYPCVYASDPVTVVTRGEGMGATTSSMNEPTKMKSSTGIRFES